MYKNILIAVDGSELSTKAAQHGAELASKLGAGLTLFHVVPPLPSFDNMSPDRVGNIHQDIVNEFIKQGREILSLTEEKLAGYGLNVSTGITVGHPAEEICKKVEAGGFDLLVMGSRGLGQIKGYLMGSVSNRVCRHANCPVLIVR
ncbi:MAG: universal stress protein [Pelotomaculaceae bacterium]|jgi:nucleotide-binding universal stress UspA family protein|nr:universal stress protein [Bacillota bacterium]HHU85556.1 universal stress protein [Peptococcaceae bacterium]